MRLKAMLVSGVVGCALLWSVTAAAETLRIQCTAPLHNNRGSCVSPNLTQASARDSVWVIFDITGPQTVRRDSVWRRPGGTIDLTYSLPRGTYTIRATALRITVDGAMRYGCPAQVSKTTDAGVPNRPTFGP